MVHSFSFLAYESIAEQNLWIIPFNIDYPESSLSSDNILWLWNKTSSLEIESRPYLLTIGASGYYRVAYEEENWVALTQSLKTKKHINRLNRAQLIDDAMNLARSNYVSYSTALELLTYLRLENDYIPWEAAFRSLEFLYSRMKSSR